jgi:hypothetical protein
MLTMRKKPFLFAVMTDSISAVVFVMATGKNAEMANLL